MESGTRPIAADESSSRPTLDEVLGTKGHVRLLRILATESPGSIASPDIATRAGLTPSGARKALRRLTRAGVVEKVGSGKSTRYALRRNGRFGEGILRLFELEGENMNPGWRRKAPMDASEAETSRSRAGKKRWNGQAHRWPVVSQGSLRSQSLQVPREGVKEGHPALDPASPEFHGALVNLLEEDLSLIRRAREKVLEKLEHRHPGNGHDLWEWRKILDTYPLPRLLHFLDSKSPRAQRLRESSPFPEVMSDRERERLRGLVHRVH